MRVENALGGIATFFSYSSASSGREARGRVGEDSRASTGRDARSSAYRYHLWIVDGVENVVIRFHWRGRLPGRHDHWPRLLSFT